MAAHSSILVWRIPGTEEPGGLYSPCGHKESDTTEQRTLFFFFFCLCLYFKCFLNLSDPVKLLIGSSTSTDLIIFFHFFSLSPSFSPSLLLLPPPTSHSLSISFSFSLSPSVSFSSSVSLLKTYRLSFQFSVLHVSWPAA